MDRRVPFEPGFREWPVTIQYRRDGETLSEYPVDDWGVARSLTIKMAREDRRGSERLIGAQVQAQFDTTWMMGYRSDMDPDLVDVPKDRRLVFNHRVLNIVAAQMVGRREGIALMTVANPSGETA